MLMIGGGASMVYHFMGDDDIARIMRHPMVSFASDAGVIEPGAGVPHPRGYGNAVRVLGEYVRERKVHCARGGRAQDDVAAGRAFRLRRPRRDSRGRRGGPGALRSCDA